MPSGEYSIATTYKNTTIYNTITVKDIKFNLTGNVQHGSPAADVLLKIDGEVGSKKAYDPRAWGKAAEKGMAARVVEACERLGSVGSAKR